MIFNSFAFAVFFCVVYALYRALGSHHRYQNRLLLVASYYFYGYWDWRFLSLIAISTLVDFFCARWIVEHRSRRNAFLLASLITNLGILFTFKYFDFFIDSFVRLLGELGFSTSYHSLQIILPVGISFYTFQTLSYSIDVWRGRLAPCRDFLDFALFVSFFPQLVAGPIERAVNFIPQIQHPRHITREQVAEGSWLVLWGLFKKVFIADNVAGIADVVFSSDFDGGGLHAAIGVYAFAVQIYCDFSGYSDIARGVSKLLGFELMVNFDLPYFARNPADLWRRWHISLSTWLRDYLYIPLGGNRSTAARTYRNLFLTMLLGGLWHGAAWTFVIWGAYHGILLGVHRAWRAFRGPEQEMGFVAHAAAIFLTFHLTCLGWLFFRAESLADAITVLSAPFGGLGVDPASSAAAVALCWHAAPLLLVQFWQFTAGEHFVVRRLPVFFRGMVYGVLFYLVAIYGGTSDAFIYFQF